MLLERFLIALAVLVIALLAVCVWQGWLAVRMRRLAVHAIPKPLAHLVPDGPALLYFTTENCAQCRLQQTPILQQLAQMTQIPIHTYDAVEQDQLARYFGIMTVPTTIWLDEQHRPTAINHGLVHLSQLRRQAQNLSDGASQSLSSLPV